MLKVCSTLIIDQQNHLQNRLFILILLNLPLMKKFTLIALLAVFSIPVLAKDGYKIKVRLTDRKDSMIYLAHYYGKNFPTVYQCDSAKMDSKGNAVFTHSEKIVGGIYMILPHDRNAYMEFLLDNGDEFSVTAAMDDLKHEVHYKNSPVNDDFLKYQNFLIKLADREKEYKDRLAKAKAKKDSTAIYDEAKSLKTSMDEYREQYTQSHPSRPAFRLSSKPCACPWCRKGRITKMMVRP